jgi:hypothetical protein
VPYTQFSPVNCRVHDNHGRALAPSLDHLVSDCEQRRGHLARAV